MRVTGVMMVMMGHEMLYYNICSACKAGPHAAPKTLIFLAFGRHDELPSRGRNAMLARLPCNASPLAAKDP